MSTEEQIILRVLDDNGPKSWADLFLKVLVVARNLSWQEASKEGQIRESVDTFQRAINRLAKIHAIGIKSDLTIYIRDPQHQLV